MDQHISAVLDGIGEDEIAAVAARVLDLPVAVLAGPPTVSVIQSPHFEARTVAILRVSGVAEAGGRPQDWSAVAKVIDFSAGSSTPLTEWVHPESEEAVYATGRFAGDGVPFRSARCYRISHPRPNVTVLWLEDLTDARPPPFSVAELARMMRHLGQWNGHHADAPSPPGLHLAEDSVFLRWKNWNLEKEIAAFRTMGDDPYVRKVYRDYPSDLVFRIFELYKPLLERTRRQGRSLCFGDANAGNMFLRPDATVAVDWASLTLDPLGGDAGVLVGSSITWGRDFVTVARNERALFRSYLEGLFQAGWHGDSDDIRRAYLVHFGIYLLPLAMFPSAMAKFPRSMLEARFAARWDEIPELAVGLAELLPSYVVELTTLTT